MLAIIAGKFFLHLNAGIPLFFLFIDDFAIKSLGISFINCKLK